MLSPTVMCCAGRSAGAERPQHAGVDLGGVEYYDGSLNPTVGFGKFGCYCDFDRQCRLKAADLIANKMGAMEWIRDGRTGSDEGGQFMKLFLATHDQS